MTESGPEKREALSFVDAYSRVLEEGSKQPRSVGGYSERYWDALDALYQAQHPREQTNTPKKTDSTDCNGCDKAPLTNSKEPF